MNDSVLLKLALMISFIGLILIYFYSGSLVLNYTSISNVAEMDIDSYVKIAGQVINYKKSTTLISFDLQDATGKINVVLFNPGDFNIKKWDQLAVFGKI